MSEPSTTSLSTLERSAPVILGVGVLLLIVYGVAAIVTAVEHDTAMPLSLEMMLIAFGSTGVLGGLLLYGIRSISTRIGSVRADQVQLGARVAANTTALHRVGDDVEVLHSKVDSNTSATATAGQAVTELGQSYCNALHRIAASRINGSHLVAVGGRTNQADN